MKNLFALLLALSLHAEIPLNERVLVVYNKGGKDSRAVADYYLRKRGIPAENLCKVDTDEDVMADSSRYEPELKKPIRACLEKIGKEKILYIVLSYQTPYSVDAGSGHVQAVDQLIADIWDEYAGPRVQGRQKGDQPYFGKAQSQGNAFEPFESLARYRDAPLAKTIYSVWRLDGANAALAKGLVDKALFAESRGLTGRGCFDIRGPIQSYFDNGYGAGEWDIYRASQLAKTAGFDIVLDDKPSEFGTPPAPPRCENAALYAGWYSLQHYNDAFSWAPGAVGFHLDSASATNPRKADNWAGGALLKGITATSGAVTEPFLEGLVHPDQIFLYLFQGANVGDAVLRGTRWLKWMIINIGDPLYRPFRAGAGPFGSTIYHETWLGIVPDSLVGGGTARGQLALGETPDKPLQVSFKSSHPELVTVPANSTIPPASTGAEFALFAKSPDQPTSVTITATAGLETLTNTLSLYPLLMDLTLSQPSLKSESSLTAAVDLFVPAPGDGVVVKLSCDQPNLILPAELKIPPGARKGTFTVTAKGVKADSSATITAKVNGAAKTVSLKLTP